MIFGSFAMGKKFEVEENFIESATQQLINNEEKSLLHLKEKFKKHR